MRLARTLLKATAILIIVAAAFGGAVALASTLFERPPRDAAEFAARVEAGSERAPSVGGPTAAERRYVLQLNELCGRTDEAFDDLRDNSAGKARGERLREWRKVFARFDQEFRALKPPRRARQDAARITGLDRATLALVDGALAALRAGDRDAYEAKIAASELIDERFDETMLRLGARACATD